jgi:hypothetical protein
MIKTVTEMIVDGYGTGEVDFLAHLNQADLLTQIGLNTQILQPFLAVLETERANAVLTITGDVGLPLFGS